MIIYRCLTVHQQWQEFVALLSEFNVLFTKIYHHCYYISDFFCKHFDYIFVI